MQQLKIKQTTLPKDRLSYNDWCKQFNVSSRCPRHTFYAAYETPTSYNKVYGNIKNQRNEKV